MDSWKVMANERKMKQHRDGFLIIVPTQQPDVVPVECSVCKFLMKDFVDVVEHKKHGCCYNCAMKWAHPNSELWASGWRPPSDEIHTEIDRRNCLPSFIYQVK